MKALKVDGRRINDVMAGLTAAFRGRIAVINRKLCVGWRWHECTAGQSFQPACCSWSLSGERGQGSKGCQDSSGRDPSGFTGIGSWIKGGISFRQEERVDVLYDHFPPGGWIGDGLPPWIGVEVLKEAALAGPTNIHMLEPLVHHRVASGFIAQRNSYQMTEGPILNDDMCK